MNIKTLKAALLGLAVTVSSLANAGIITDTDNDSFIDETTGLEWMDFGINNIHSYNEVSDLLTSTYTGWNLATESQVLNLWTNAFEVQHITAWPNTAGGGYLYYMYANDIGKQIMLDVYSTMAYGYENWRGIGSLGLFERADGGMAYAFFTSWAEHTEVYGRDNDYESYRASNDLRYSTMLVKSTEVPEPSTLAIFALGMIGLASRRFKK